MKFNSILDPIVFDTATGTVGTTGSTIRARIKMEPRRLEGILLQVRGTSSSQATLNAEGFPVILKEVRLKVTDILGSRNAVQARSAGLLDYVASQGGALDYQTRAAFLSSSITAGAFCFNVYVPLRHLGLSEPAANLTSIPLNQLKDDAILELDFGLAAALSTSTAPTLASVTVTGTAVLREAPLNMPYIPTELRTDLFTSAQSGRVAYEYGSYGFLSASVIQLRTAAAAFSTSAAFSAAAASDPAVMSASGFLVQEYGRKTIARTLPDHYAVLSELSSPGLGAKINSSIVIDTLADGAAPNNVFGLDSLLDLTPATLAGDKCRLVFNDWTSTNPTYAGALITNHRFLFTDRSQIDLLNKFNL